MRAFLLSLLIRHERDVDHVANLKAGLAAIVIIKKLKRKAKQGQEAMGRIVNILDETFSGMRVIKAFNARNFIIKKIDDETSYHRRVNLSIARKNNYLLHYRNFSG